MSDNKQLKKFKDDGYQDWLKRRNRLNSEIMYYKRHQWELLKKYSLFLIFLIGFLYLFFGVGRWVILRLVVFGLTDVTVLRL